MRAALVRVADAALQLRGHYRFFAYSDGRVGERDDGPSTLETASAPRCVDGQFVTMPVKSTRGMVCSTFVWQAVQLANHQIGVPRILLDGRPARQEPGHDVAELCEQLTAVRDGLQRVRSSILDPADPQDGMYFYDAASRHDAALALQERLIAKVMEKIGDFMDEAGGSADWNPTDPAFVMTSRGNGRYTFTTTISTPGTYQFKATNGAGWDYQVGTDGASADAATYRFTTTRTGEKVEMSIDLGTRKLAVKSLR